MRNNDFVTELPEDVFGSVSFQEIYLNSDLNLRIVHRAAILASKDRLKTLHLRNNALDDFAFDILPELTSLGELRLDGNILTALPSLSSGTLTFIALQGNNIDTLEPGWNIPTLKTLDLGECNHS